MPSASHFIFGGMATFRCRRRIALPNQCLFSVPLFCLSTLPAASEAMHQSGTTSNTANTAMPWPECKRSASQRDGSRIRHAKAESGVLVERSAATEESLRGPVRKVGMRNWSFNLAARMKIASTVRVRDQTCAKEQGERHRPRTQTCAQALWRCRPTIGQSRFRMLGS